MARPSLTTTAAPHLSPAGPSIAAPPVTVHLVSPEDALWAEFARRLPLLRWSQHDSVADLIEQIPASETAIAVIDARAIDDLGATVGTLLAHAAGVVPVALIEPAQEPAARRLLRSQVLFELLPLDLEPRAIGERLERATEEALARRALLASHAAPPAPASAGRRRAASPQLVAGGATLLLACIALGVTLWERTHAPSPAGPTATPAVPPAPGPTSASHPPAAAAVTASPAPAADTLAETDSELADARRALREKHYVEPDNDSALSHYHAALALSPDNEEARQGLARVNEALLARAETAVAARDFGVALRALEASRALDPNHPRLAALDQQLTQQRRELTLAQIQAAIEADNFERASQLIAQAEQRHQLGAIALTEARAALQSRQGSQEVTSLVRLATARIDQGQLVEPAGDSAKAYLGEAERRSPPESNRAVRRLRDEYQRALAARYGAAYARHDTPAAAGWMKELQASGASHERIVELTGGMTDTRAVAAVSPPPGPTASAAPAPATETRPPPIVSESPAPTPAAATPAAPVITTAAHLSGGLDPTYPAAALRRRETGWVEVDVRVSAQGRALDAKVRAAQPEHVFESAALDAIRHAHYTPARTADGVAVEGTTAIKVRFELPENR